MPACPLSQAAEIDKRHARRAVKAAEAATTSNVTANVIEISGRHASHGIPATQELLKEIRTLDEEGQR